MLGMKKVMSKVISQVEIAEGVFDLWLETDMAQMAKAGQFICVYTKDKSMILPRPISICEVNADRTALRIVYRIAGAGTTEFSTYQAGEEVAILGTLGNGFPVEAGTGKVVVLMGGGIGIPPMLQTAKDLEAEVHSYIGYRDNQLFLADEFANYSTVHIATEDGSEGTKGNVIDALKESGVKPDVIMACGPMPMLRAIKQYAETEGIVAYISLEEHMACGVGACLGCVCKTKEIDHHSHVHNARICTDGPVFLASDVLI
ncbi:MAG: dihydroorotate dehydrogenase electron transfer subunit [Lachnospiraceae bacterium]